MRFWTALLLTVALLGCQRTPSGPAVERSAAATAGPTPLEAEGLHNFFRVSDRVYSGSSPDGENGFAALAGLGVRTGGGVVLLGVGHGERVDPRVRLSRLASTSRQKVGVWSGERGRITPPLLTRAVPEIGTRRVHICGPTEMTDPTRQMLRDLGVPSEAIRVESFASPSRSAAVDKVVPSGTTNGHVDSGAQSGNGDDATLTFARSRKTANPAGQTVLETAEALRIPMSYECRAGVCAQCKTRLLAGRVVMDAEDALDAIDRANNVILACQARCVDQVVVDA
jgi:ferredoxin